MLVAILSVLLGFVALLWSADRLVSGASSLAAYLGIPSLIIGLVVVGFGTSAPEMVVSAVSAINGQTGLAVGNALGSNIANVGLVLGATALFYPLSVSSNILRREFPALLLVTLVTGVLLADGRLGRIDGMIFVLALFVVTGFIGWLGARGKDDILRDELAKEIPPRMSNAKASTCVLIGLVVLPVSSQLLVTGAVSIARYMGVDSMILGLTVVAMGTSLPELATCFAAARRREHDLAVGNILGSNMFNLLGVLGIAGLIKPTHLPELSMIRDFGIMSALTVVFLLLAYNSQGRGHLSRRAGALMLIAYFGYLGVLFATAHSSYSGPG